MAPTDFSLSMAFFPAEFGIFPKDQISVSWEEDRIPMPPELQRFIQRNWDEKVRDATRRGSFLFPGELCRLKGWERRGDLLHLEFQLTDYCELLGTNYNLTEVLSCFGPHFLSNGTGVNGTVVTSDGKVIISRRSQRVIDHPGCLDVFGGHLHPSEHREEGIPSPFLAMTEEVEAELGLPREAVAEIVCLGFVFHWDTLKPELIFDLRVEPSFAEAVVLAQGSREAFENMALFAIEDSAEALADFLMKRHGEITPAAQGTLYYHGLHRGFFPPPFPWR